jgi:hypothetical protein
MTNDEKRLNTQELLREFMMFVVKDIYEMALHVAPVVREDALDTNINRLIDRLVDRGGGPIGLVFDLVDGRARPLGWPRLRLINSETGEDLSDDLAAALSGAESDFLGMFLDVSLHSFSSCTRNVVISESEQDDAFIERLKDLLGYIASEWHRLSRQGETSKAQDVVRLYRAVLTLLWDWGWRGLGLLPEEVLPNEHMPDYFLEYWRVARKDLKAD